MSKSLRNVLALLLCLFLFLCIFPAAYAQESENGETAPVPVGTAARRFAMVYFLCDKTQDLEGLCVYADDGQLCRPVTDTDTGKTDYSSYQLQPGNYTYEYHNADGRFEDLKGSFSIGADTLSRFLWLELNPIREIQSFSFTYINPIYADIVTEDDIPEPAISEEERLEQLQALSDMVFGSKRRGSALFLQDSGIVHTDIASAADELKRQNIDFEPTATIRLLVDYEASAAQWQDLCKTIYSLSIAHNGISTEGDYLRYEYGGYRADGEISSENGSSVCIFSYTLFHYTTKEQEDELTSVVNNVLASLALDGKSDYEKISAIYVYLCDTVSYGGSGNVKQTAYGALINHLCVCQGYASAFYRLCLESGIDTRIVTRLVEDGSSENHAWNIVKFGGQYYEVDATWDRGKAHDSYTYFLKGRTSWEASSHRTIGDEFHDGRFDASYVLPVYDFSDVQALVQYGSSSLNGHIIGLEDMIAAIAESRGSTALYLDQIRAVIEQKVVASDSFDTRVFEIRPVLNSYYQSQCFLKSVIGNEQLDDSFIVSLRLSVPADWAGKAVNYTLSSSGYDDVSKSVYISQSSSGTYGFTISNISYFGTVTATLIKRSVFFNSNGGSSVASQLVYYGETAVKPSSPTKAGFWFGGWYTDSACTARFAFENTPIKETTVLYAKWVTPDLVLPSALTAIDEEAFAGGVFSFVKLPEQLRSVGRNAFAQCPNLAYIYIPENVQIDAAAFGTLTGLTVFGKAGGTAASFATTYGFDFVAVS